MTDEPVVLGRLRVPRQLENRHDGGEGDIAPRSTPLGTVMSHSFLPRAIAALAPSVIAGTKFVPLVALSGTANRVTAGNLGAAPKAVDVSSVAATAEDNLLSAAGAGVETMGGRNRRLFWHVRLDKSDDSPDDAR